MTPELDTLDRYLRQEVSQLLAAVAPLTDEELNLAPPIPGANSCYVIATHVFGNMRALVLGITCGHEVHRLRAAEFVARGTVAELNSAGLHLSSEIASALADLDPNTLDDRVLPSQELWGEGTPEEQPRREPLIHALEHAGIHLGQVLLTVDFLVSARPRL